MEDEGFKSPTWDDYEEHWNRLTPKERLEHVCKCFQCSSENHIAQTIAKSSWEDIPESMQETIEMDSFFGNEVFDTINW